MNLTTPWYHIRFPSIVIDTNVLVAGLRSRNGSSHRVVRMIGTGYFELCVSVPLVLEYEDVLTRERFGFSDEEINDVLNYCCSAARHCPIYFLWRPFLSDPKDDMVLELAVQSQSEFIVTFNVRDFQNTESFGVRAIRPAQFLEMLGESK